ncbi:MAG: hypothetical protein IT303_06900 [Dehalococcoidia bacterium]|nr:hypothetical protein [Dehalococcoidia bacterium]
MPGAAIDTRMPPGPLLSRAVFRVPIVVVFVALDVAALGLLPLPETLVAVSRSAIAPGLGLFPEEVGVAIGLLVTALVCTWAWFRWGAVWPMVATWWLSIVLTVRAVPTGEHTHGAAAGVLAPDRVLAVHEFTWLMAVYLLVYWAGTLVRRIPFVEHLASVRQRRRPADASAITQLPLPDRARAVSLWEIARRAGGAAPPRDFLRQALGDPAHDRGRRLVALLGRAALRDPVRDDNAHVRAAMVLVGGDDRDAPGAARRARLGMPASEPGWVQLLDGTLLAAALAPVDPGAGRRWAYAMEHWFALRHGHRPEARHEIAGIARGRAPAWQHATAAVVAAMNGWVEPRSEWDALRPQVLAAVGRGGRRTDDNRLIAAGRCWAAILDDPEATRLLARVTSSPRDPFAQALESLSAALRTHAGARAVDAAGAKPALQLHAGVIPAPAPNLHPHR